MKMCYVSNAMLGSRNASAVHVVKMCNALASVFSEVVVVSSVEERIDSLKDVYGELSFRYVALPPLFHIFFFRMIVSLIACLNSNVIYSRWTTFLIFYPFLVGKIRFIELHVVPSSLTFRVGMVLSKLFRAKISYVFITNKLRDDFFSEYTWLNPDQCVVLPDGADPVISCVQGGELKNKIGICGYVGSFSEGKGIETVLALGKLMPDISFIVAGGSDSEVRECKLKSSPNVQFLGFVQPSAIRKVFELFSVALLPNKSQVFIRGKNIGDWTSPMKMFEYMAAGKVIIASDLPVLREVLVDRENCLLVNPDKLEEWEHAIRSVVDDNQLAIDLASRGLNDLLTRYSWSARAETVRKIADSASFR